MKRHKTTQCYVNYDNAYAKPAISDFASRKHLQPHLLLDAKKHNVRWCTYQLDISDE